MTRCQGVAGSRSPVGDNDCSESCLRPRFEVFGWQIEALCACMPTRTHITLLNVLLVVGVDDEISEHRWHAFGSPWETMKLAELVSDPDSRFSRFWVANRELVCARTQPKARDCIVYPLVVWC